MLSSLDSRTGDEDVEGFSSKTRIDARRVCTTYILVGSGGGTRLVAPGLQACVIGREWRWKSDAFDMYVRVNREDEERVLQALRQKA